MLRKLLLTYAASVLALAATVHGQSWSTLTPMPTARRSLVAAAVVDTVYAIGGQGSSPYLNVVEAYDVNADQWTTLPPMPTPRYGLCAAAIDGIVYAVGGYAPGYVAALESYDPSTEIWETLTPMPTARENASAAAIDGKLYVVGGKAGAGISNLYAVLEIYDPVTDSWSTGAPMPTSRIYAGAAAIDGLLYVVGGRDLGGVLPTMVVYDPSTDTWDTGVPMPTGLSGPAVCALGGKLHVIGGADATANKGTVAIYDPVPETWSEGPPMPTIRSEVAGAVAAGHIYVLGGMAGVPLDVVEAFEPASGGVAGTITTTTWTAANSPYRVTGAVTVPTGNTLTIEAGVEVLFDADVQFIVQGSLQAVGTESDSIRFIPGTAAEWGGIEFSGGDSSTIAYARISGANADGPPATLSRSGGGARVSDVGTVLSVSQSRICNNTTGGNGGAILVTAGARLTAFRTIFSSNTVAMAGGGIYVDVAATVELSNVIVSGNNASATMGGGGGGLFIYNNSPGTVVHNSIFWGNTTPASGTESIGWYTTSSEPTVTFSDIEGGFTGTGNIDVDPQFVDAAGGDYSLQLGSPCINAGDPASPLDPDGTRADMGALAHTAHTDPNVLAIEDVIAGPGAPIVVHVSGDLVDASNVSMAILFDPTILIPQNPVIGAHVFDGQGGALWDWNVVPGSAGFDTLFVNIAGSTPVTATGAPIAELLFSVSPDAPNETVTPMTWVPEWTDVNEATSSLSGGTVSILLGDATHDGTVSAFDAAKILSYTVRKTSSIDAYVANVSCNSTVTAYDAALILQHTVGYIPEFPRAIGCPAPKVGDRSAVVLTWSRSEDAWDLVASDGSSIHSGDLSLGVSGDVTVRSDAMIAVAQDGGAVRIAFARLSDEPVLLRVIGSESRPEIVSIALNDGAIPVVAAQPSPFALAQNAPNPFNPSTTIRFAVVQGSPVRLTIHNTAGQLVRTLIDGNTEAGSHQVVWDGLDKNGRAVSSGAYLYRLTSAEGTMVRKMLLVR